MRFGSGGVWLVREGLVGWGFGLAGGWLGFGQWGLIGWGLVGGVDGGRG